MTACFGAPKPDLDLGPSNLQTVPADSPFAWRFVVSDANAVTSPVKVIALDGPAGSGKSTIARLFSQRIQWTYLETGAIYRSLGLICIEQGIPLADEDRVAAMVGELDLSFRAASDGSNRVLLSERDITEECYSPRIADAASTVSAYPKVRSRLIAFQQDFARSRDGVVMEGRDIGTVIFPNAPLKVYLTASPEERARRRQDQLATMGSTLPFAQVLADVNSRDQRDSTRAAAPLKQASDAQTLDTDGITINEVLDALEAMARERSLV